MSVWWPGRRYCRSPPSLARPPCSRCLRHHALHRRPSPAQMTPAIVYFPRSGDLLTTGWIILVVAPSLPNVLNLRPEIGKSGWPNSSHQSGVITLGTPRPPFAEGQKSAVRPGGCAHASLRRSRENETDIQAPGHLNGRLMRTIRFLWKRGTDTQGVFNPVHTATSQPRHKNK